VNALVAGIGNIFFADDGFGVEVARRLGACSVPPGTRVVDYGIRGVHLAYELLDGYELLVLVDAVPMGQPPGALAVIEVDTDDLAAVDDVAIDAHTMTPAAVLGTLARLGGRVDRVLVVGSEPAAIEEGIGLSEPVAAAVDGAVEVVLSVLADAFATAGKES
jgi:hydrogenase maturation protease